MKTNREVINGFRNIVGDKIRISDETGWSPRLVYQFLLAYRNKLLDERIKEKSYKLSQSNYQSTPCMGLDKIDIIDCPCAPPSGKMFLRTILPIPKHLHIKQVSSITYNTNYDYVEWGRFKYKLESGIIAERKQPYWTKRRSIVNGEEDEYIYLLNDNDKDSIIVNGVFSHPLDVQSMKDCNGKSKIFFPLDQTFVMDDQLLALMYDLALQQLLKGKAQHADIYNNMVDNLTATPIPIK